MRPNGTKPVLPISYRTKVVLPLYGFTDPMAASHRIGVVSASVSRERKNLTLAQKPDLCPVCVKKYSTLALENAPKTSKTRHFQPFTSVLRNLTYEKMCSFYAE